MSHGSEIRPMRRERRRSHRKDAPSLINQGNTELRIEQLMSRLTPQGIDVAEKKELMTQKGVVEPSKKNKAEEEAIRRRKAR